MPYKACMTVKALLPSCFHSPFSTSKKQADEQDLTNEMPMNNIFKFPAQILYWLPLSVTSHWLNVGKGKGL